MVNHYYDVDKANRTIRCWLVIPYNPNYWQLSGKWEGVAKCDPNDEWNEEIGKDIAYKRALIKLKKAEIKLTEIHVQELKDVVREYFELQDRIDCCESRIFQLSNMIAEYKD